MRSHNRLSAVKIPTLKAGRFSDGAGLYIQVFPDHRSYYVYRLNRNGRVSWKSLGSTKKLSLAAARQLTRRINDDLALGNDPWAVKARTPTFSEVAQEYIDQILVVTNPRSKDHWHRSLALYAGTLANKPIDEIDVHTLVNVLKPIWKTKADTAGRVRGRIARILGYGKSKGYRDGPNPGAWAENLDGLLPAQAKVVEHFKALPYEQLPEFIAGLRKRQGIGAKALELIILCATRCGEAVNAEWTEIDWVRETWTIPARRAKTRRDHCIPLSAPALALLKDLAQAPVSRYIFPGLKPNTPISAMATYKFMKEIGVTVHGTARSGFRDWCANETEFPRDLVEEALAHSLGKVEKAYRRGQAVERRRKLMTAWADYLGGMEKVAMIRAA